ATVERPGAAFPDAKWDPTREIRQGEVRLACEIRRLSVETRTDPPILCARPRASLAKAGFQRRLPGGPFLVQRTCRQTERGAMAACLETPAASRRQKRCRGERHSQPSCPHDARKIVRLLRRLGDARFPQGSPQPDRPSRIL